MAELYVDPVAVRDILRLHIGRRRAIQARDIAQRLGLRGRYADRPVRIAIRQLRRQGELILSATNSPPGYFLARSLDEWREYGAPMRSRAMDLLTTVAEMDKAAARKFKVPEELRPALQLELGLR